MGYEVRCVDGPAEGFAYYVGPEPEWSIMLVPRPQPHGESPASAWFRGFEDPGVPPWPGAAHYKRTEVMGENLEGDTVLAYRFDRREPE